MDPIDPSNWSDALANALHQTNVAIVARDLPIEKQCGHLTCPYYAFRHEPKVRSGRLTALYECHHCKHVSIVIKGV